MMVHIAGLRYLTILLLVGPVIFVSPSENSSKECDGMKLDECLQQLRTFLRLTSLPFPSETAELDKLCNTLAGGYKCSVKIWNLPNCLSPHEQRTLRVSIDMGQYTMFMFCPSGGDNVPYLRDVLLQNSDCIRRQKKALDCCAEQSHLPELPVKRLLEGDGKNLFEIQTEECCSVSNYLRCVRSAVLDSCGYMAANLTTEYIRRASGEEFEFVCQKMPDYPELLEGVCRTPVPVCSGATATLPLELSAFVSFLLVAATILKRSSIL